MNETDMIKLRNVLALVMVDGEVSSEEREFIRKLRENLGIGREVFRAACEQVQQNPKQLVVPTDPEAARETLALLVDAAGADGRVSDREQRVLDRVARFIERKTAEMGPEAADEATSVESEGDDGEDARMNAAIEELYARFGEWTDTQRRAHLDAFEAMGSAAAIPLLHVVESYRSPDSGDGLVMKAMIIDRLARIGDDRVVYYLAQQVSLSDTDDEVTCAALREAASEAIGAITGQGFTRDAAGAQACRQWWAGEGTQTYRTLVL